MVIAWRGGMEWVETPDTGCRRYAACIDWLIKQVKVNTLE